MMSDVNFIVDDGSALDDGGPAFPRTGEGFGNPRYDAPGMSLRDYFAAHAPESVPGWFKHEPPAEAALPERPSWQQVDSIHQHLVMQWQEDPCFDLPEELSWFEEKHKAYAAAETGYRHANYWARMTQWRFAYADAMLATRAKGRRS